MYSDKMQIWFIVAHSHLQGISKNGSIPWRCKNDMKFVKKITTAAGLKNGLLMGRKTFESIGTVLPGRETIVVSSRGATAVSENVHFVNNIASAIQTGETLGLDVLWIFGGGTIYDQFLQDEFRDKIDGFFITRVPEFECDTFIHTNLCDILLPPANIDNVPVPVPVPVPIYRSFIHDKPSIILETCTDGVYELTAFSRLPVAGIHKQWFTILDSFSVLAS